MWAWRRAKRKSGRRGEVRSVAQICKLIKLFWDGENAAVARWVCFGMDSRDWRTTALIVDDPYEEQGMGGRSK